MGSSFRTWVIIRSLKLSITPLFCPRAYSAIHFIPVRGCSIFHVTLLPSASLVCVKFSKLYCHYLHADHCPRFWCCYHLSSYMVLNDGHFPKKIRTTTIKKWQNQREQRKRESELKINKSKKKINSRKKNEKG